MSKKTTDQKTKKQAVKKPVELTDDELEMSAAGGTYRFAEPVLIDERKK